MVKLSRQQVIAASRVIDALLEMNERVEAQQIRTALAEADGIHEKTVRLLATPQNLRNFLADMGVSGRVGLVPPAQPDVIVMNRVNERLDLLHKQLEALAAGMELLGRPAARKRGGR